MPEERRDLPTFIVIGAMKCGTTSLALYLGSHPEVFVTKPKEPMFFVSQDPSQDLDWYRSLFADGTEAVARGEASTHYTHMPFEPCAAPAIQDLLPDVKLLYIVRDPIERALSHYSFRIVQGMEDRPVADAINQDSRYVNVSRYSYQLQPYLDRFPRDQLMILGSQELRHARHATMRRVFEFIGVNPDLEVGMIEREFLRTEEIRSERPWQRAARRVARYTPAHLLPRQVKIGLYRRTKGRAHMPDTTLPVDLHRRMWDTFAEDLEHFRKISDVSLELGERP